MALWHFSEEGGIAQFRPHVAKTSDRDEALVWAIHDWHAVMYFTPRDCPRVCFWAGERTTPEDREAFLGGVTARMAMAVDSPARA